MNEQQISLLDICERKHGGNAESIAANPSQAAKTIGRQEVMNTLGYSWLTSKEIASLMGKDLNCISGRISELKALGMVEKTGVRRGGCAELRRK